MSAAHPSSCCWSPCHGGYAGGVTFVLGALDGDPVKLNLLKDYVCKSLYSLVHGFRATAFNIIHISHMITKWCDCCVTWRPEAVAQAVAWTRALVCGSGANPTSALAAALQDPSCKAVYLVLDALPPSVLTDIYDFLARNENACAVNVVYLTEEPRHSQAEGSFREINLKPLGPAGTMGSASNLSVSSCCLSLSPCTSSTVLSAELRPPLSCSVTCKEAPACCPPPSVQISRTLAAPSLLRGARVLARRDRDGLFYMGHIACEVEGSAERFLVEFEKCRSLKGKAQFRMQETPVCDIIHYEDARWRPLAPGDHVLAPLGTSMEQYGPGTILRGAENRERGSAFDSNGVLVTFWNGKTKQVPAGVAIWIPQELSDRITLELHIPLEARKRLMESCPGFPFLGTGSKHPPGEDPPPTGTHDCLYCHPGPDVCQRCHVPEELWAALRNSLNHISNMSLDKETPAKKAAKKKDLKQDVPSRPIQSKEKVKPQRKVILEREESQRRKQKEHFLCNTDTQTEGVIRPDSSPSRYDYNTTHGDYDDAMVSSYNPPTWRLNNTTHLQATLERINRAMKEDRQAMESALLERRPRSAPLKLNYEAKAQRNQQLRERKEADKAALWRIQAEERQRRREEKFKEMEQREVTFQDGRRLRSDQRILLDLERRQNQEGLEAQQAENRRAAAEERSRQMDEDTERERRNEEDRMRYWRDLRQQRESAEMEKSRELYGQEEKKRQQEADLREWRRHQQLQAGGERRISSKLEQFYRQAGRESQRDQNLQEYLKDHNLQTLRSAVAL